MCWGFFRKGKSYNYILLVHSISPLLSKRGKKKLFLSIPEGGYDCPYTPGPAQPPPSLPLSQAFTCKKQHKSRKSKSCQNRESINSLGIIREWCAGPVPGDGHTFRNSERKTMEKLCLWRFGAKEEEEKKLVSLSHLARIRFRESTTCKFLIRGQHSATLLTEHFIYHLTNLVTEQYDVLPALISPLFLAVRLNCRWTTTKKRCLDV